MHFEPQALVSAIVLFKMLRSSLQTIHWIVCLTLSFESPQHCMCNKIKRQANCTCLSFYGGDEGIRTPGLCVANALLYQLSHTPKFIFFVILSCNCFSRLVLQLHCSSGRGQALPALATNSSLDCLLNASRQLSHTPEVVSA